MQITSSRLLTTITKNMQTTSTLKLNREFTRCEKTKEESLRANHFEHGCLNEESELRHPLHTHLNRIACPKERIEPLLKTLVVYFMQSIFHLSFGAKPFHAQSTLSIVSLLKQHRTLLFRIVTVQNQMFLTYVFLDL